MEEQSSALDQVLEKFSISGRYHLKFMFFVFIVYAFGEINCMNYIFAVEESGYRCIDKGFENSTCSAINGTLCSKWVYDNPYSFVAEFQLACQEWKRTLVGTVHSFGYMVGLLIVGPLSDRIGRKKVLVLTGVLGAVFGLARSFTSYYWLYIFFEFMEAAIGDTFSPAYVLNLEIITAKKRVVYYYICAIGTIAGDFLLPLTAWGVTYWRTFLQVIYTPVLFLVTYLIVVDESPRWLLSNGKKEKAVAILQKMAKTNKIKLDKNDLDGLQAEDKDVALGFIHLLKMTFRSKTLLKRCLVCIVWWITSTFVSYGMMINTVSLQGNKFINYALVAVMELPGNFIINYVSSFSKRKTPLISCFFANAVLCMVQPFIPQEYPWFSVAVYIISKMISYIYFNITYMYTLELFPTYTRNSMHALCSSIGRIGSIIAPQTPLLMVYWKGLPTFIFGSVSLVAAFVTFLVPDTADNSLPDTVCQAETLGKKRPNKLKDIDNIAMSTEAIERKEEET